MVSPAPALPQRRLLQRSCVQSDGLPAAVLHRPVCPPQVSLSQNLLPGAAEEWHTD